MDPRDLNAFVFFILYNKCAHTKCSSGVLGEHCAGYVKIWAVSCLWTFCKLPQSLAWWELVEYFRSFFCWHQRNLKEGPRREVALEDLCLLHRRWCLQAILKLGSILHFTAKPQLPAPKLTLPQLEHWSGAVFGKSTVSNPLCWAPVKTKKRDRFSVYPVQGCMCFSTIFRNFLWKSWQWMIYFKQCFKRWNYFWSKLNQ